MNSTVQGAFKSKTNWFGVAVMVLGQALDLLPMFESAIDQTVFGNLTTGIGAAIVALRFVTSKPLSEK